MAKHLIVCALALLGLSACGNSSDDPSGVGNGNGNDEDGGLNGGGGDGGNGGACEEHVLNGERGIPNVLIVLDRSTSMGQPEGMPRWPQAVDAVKNVTSNLESGIAFGLMMFPNGTSECGAGTMSVTPATGMADMISEELDNAGPTGATPTAPSLDAARDVLGDLDGESYVLLVTDGAPNCNSGHDKPCTSTYSGSDAAKYCLDDERTVDAVTALADAHVPTYVIGFDTDDWEETLNAMAAAGGTGEDEYFPVTNGTALENKLAELAGNVVSCSFTLDAKPADYRFVHVTLNGEDVKHVSQTDDGSGWDLDGKRIDLKGATCDAVKDDANAELGIVVECDQLLL